ncbi:MAG: hypothetical protein NC418_02380 [Muribaculaceae bacterium]|nr:hypothetical protein [Muribaculaceae bacterium]
MAQNIPITIIFAPDALGKNALVRVLAQQEIKQDIVRLIGTSICSGCTYAKPGKDISETVIMDMQEHKPVAWIHTPFTPFREDVNKKNT